MARTAVIAGTASAVAGNVHHRQEQKWASQEQQAQQDAYTQQQMAAAQQQAYQPPPAAPAQDDTMAQVQKLAELHSAGILSDEEFAAAKAKALGI
jgi:hypothetical protein